MKMQRTLEQVLEDPIVRALNPKGKQFFDPRFLPPKLNPYAHYFISIAALTLRGLPHLKTIPAFQMMLEDFKDGQYKNKHTIVVDSSGNTAHAVARLAPAFGFDEVKVVLSADVPESKKGILAALSSVEIIEVGGGKSVTKRAAEEAQRPGHYHLNQYDHWGNMRAHESFTGPEVLRAVRSPASENFSKSGIRKRSCSVSVLLGARQCRAHATATGWTRS
jgi:Pyridoxal-phosphate dependent enzyme